MALNSYENRVYDLRLEDGSHIVTKFYRPGRWNREQIKEEHTFILQLQDDEIPVCAPLFINDRDTIREIEGIYYAVWPRTGGRSADEFTDDQLETLGRLLARIHNMGAVKKAAHRISLTADNYALQPLQFLLDNNFLPSHCRERFSNSVREIADIYETLSRDIPFHRIHGDCHPWNLLLGMEGWFFLDFDDFHNGPAVQDVWMLVPARDTEGLRQREIFLGAYRQFRDFEDSWLRLIEPLRSLRFIWYAGWIARRWNDPAFPAAFPHFGTVEFWEDETADLEDQLEIIHQRSEDLPENLRRTESEDEEEKELSNSDFLWDWEDPEKS